ncbi:hypothetical protein K470DRAFT_265525 [Piedraia hortae CBS 480.64]|uniref:Uncharacterized protein n=1 Tax=Piedraia hortae CBS 480.64 TaxID=1314780 RepID=A0A6A7BWS8_9PEZI|nr:hypothetical protein K470DRAFT_265525 [Piedraia hortae CBS 480.64]
MWQKNNTITLKYTTQMRKGMGYSQNFYKDPKNHPAPTTRRKINITPLSSLVSKRMGTPRKNRFYEPPLQTASTNRPAPKTPMQATPQHQIPHHQEGDTCLAPRQSPLLAPETPALSRTTSARVQNVEYVPLPTP